MLHTALLVGRGEMIRTSDPLHPMQVRYQAALRPDRSFRLYQMRLLKGGLRVTSPLEKNGLAFKGAKYLFELGPKGGSDCCAR